MKQRYFLLLIIPMIIFLLLAFTYDTPFVERLDAFITLTAMNIRTEALTVFFVAVTHIGGWKITAPIWFILCVCLLIYRKGRAVLFLTSVFWGARMLNWQLKEMFARLRPDIDQLVEAPHFSFPSGHAMNSMAFYGAVFILVQVYAKEKRTWSQFVSIFLVLLILLIGMSRVYLGVHYLTDILAGYSAGFVVLSSMYWLFRQKSS
jgi:undecaprenyl-diphosphatase